MLRNCKLMCAASLGKICASDHAMNAIDEMSALTHDFDAFTDVRGALPEIAFLRDKPDFADIK